MKIYRLFILLSPFAILFLFSCQSKKGVDADVYCNSLQKLEDTVIIKLDSFFQSTRFRAFDTKEYFQKAIDEIDIQLLNLNKIGYFKEDSTLFHSLNLLFADIDKVLQSEGVKIVELDKSLLLDYDKQKINQLDSLESVAIEKIYNLQLRFDSVMVEFLHRYGFDVELDTTQYELKD